MSSFVVVYICWTGKMLESIKKFFREREWLDIVLITVFIIVTSFFVSNHLQFLYADRGRELLIPEEMLNGKILYKDITMIYFPLAYYINAFIYKLIGVNINSFAVTQTIFCSFFMTAYYFCSRIFVSRKESFVITFLIIITCLFPYTDLFSYITPYSHSMAYGSMGFFFCAFSLIKLFKTDKIKWAYIASVFAGFSFMCKMEFVIAPLMLLIAGFLYKKLSLFQYFKIGLLFLIFPLITICLLWNQGVTISEIYDALVFGGKFAKTTAMTNFLSDIGMYPLDMQLKWYLIKIYIPHFFTFVCACLAFLKLQQKFNKPYILPLAIVVMYLFFYENYKIHQYWILLPVFVLIYSLINIKKLIAGDRAHLILVISALLISERTFFAFNLFFYGIFSFPLLFLSLYVLLKDFLPDTIINLKTKEVLCFITMVLFCLYSGALYARLSETPRKFETQKGTIYLSKSQYSLIKSTLIYIIRKADKDSTVLVLPEGNLINFLSDRKVDMKCFMMDRLYHDAYGEKEAKNKIAGTNSDYIVLIKDETLSNNHFPYLYESDNSLAMKYIDKNYTPKRRFIKGTSKITIYRKKVPAK